MTTLRINIERLKVGMLIRRTVYSRNGVMLVAENTKVTEDVKKLLQKYSISYVYIDWSGNKTSQQLKEQQELVDEEKMQEFSEDFRVAENQLSHQFMEIAENNNEIDVQRLLSMLNGLINKADSYTGLCNMLMRMKKTAEGLYSHSINVAMYAQILAKWIGCTEEEIELVTIAGMLHDIGLLKIPNIKINEISFRDELKFGKYGKHVILGYNMIKNKALDIRVKQAVLTHHERVNGSGFPLKAGGRNINTIARIVAIADVYDTLTMHQKGEKEPSPFEVLEQLVETAKERLDTAMLLVFVEKIADTFIQHQVELSDGRKGIVVMLNKIDLAHPLIQAETQFVDLAKNKEIKIERILN